MSMIRRLFAGFNLVILILVIHGQCSFGVATPKQGDSEECKFMLVTIVKCLLTGSINYASATGKLYFPESLSDVDPALRCPCSNGDPYVYLVSGDRQSFVLCCPVAFRAASQHSRPSYAIATEAGFGSLSLVDLKFPIRPEREAEIEKFLGFEQRRSVNCKRFGKYRVLGVTNKDSLVTIVLNPDPLMKRLKSKFRLEGAYHLSKRDLDQVVSECEITDPEVLAELKRHSQNSSGLP
jgi:hypothetical protein